MEKPQTSQIKLGYWAIRGRGQISRLLLSYCSANWADVKYTDANQWFHGDKKNLGLQFPNLPYLVDGNFKITQSTAIERYIIEKFGKSELLGKSLEQRAKVNMLLGVLNDIRTAYSSLLMDKLGYKQRMNKVWDQVKPKLQYLRQFLKDKKEFALGYLTLADFMIAEISYYIATLYPQQYKQFQFLQRIRELFNSLPQIKQYYSEHRAIKWPFVTPSMAAIEIKGDE